MRSSPMNESLPQLNMKAAVFLESDKLCDPPDIAQFKYSSIHRRPQQQKEDVKRVVKAKEEPKGDHKVTFDEKNAKTNAKPTERAKQNVAVKARKAQATDIRGLPEMPTIRPAESRVRRRARTSVLKKSQQDLVLGSNKVNGKPKMLRDQFISDVQSLQVQVIKLGGKSSVKAEAEPKGHAKMLDDQNINCMKSLHVQVDKEDAKRPVKAEEEPEGDTKRAVKAKEEPNGDAKNTQDKTQAKTNTKAPERAKDFNHVHGARRRHIQGERIQKEKNGEEIKILREPDHPEPSSLKTIDLLIKEMQKEDINSLVKEQEEPKGDAKATFDKKQARTNAKTPERPKETVDALRGRRGQASDVRSQVYRVQMRSKFSKRMKFLQDLVPGCHKVCGKVEMLDEIIKYIQSLQLQVELAKRDSKKEPLVDSHCIDIEEINSEKDHEAHNMNDVVDTQKLGSSETDLPDIDIENATNILHHEAQNGSNGGSAKVGLEWFFVIINLVLEFPSIILDELSSVHKPRYALFAMLVSLLGIIMCTGEFFHKARRERVIWKWKETVPWLYYPSESHKRFGTFKDVIGLVCAFGQYIVTTINYALYHRQVDNPIKLSVWPVIFAFGLLCSKFLGDPEKRAIG